MSVSVEEITHDAAVAAAAKLTDDLQGLVFESEVSDLWHLLYETVKAAVEAAFIMAGRQTQAVAPSVN